MSIEITNDEELNAIKLKIADARAWAEKYFNSKQAGDKRFVDENLNFIQAFFIRYPEPDKMLVSPSIMGTPAFLWRPYQLHFKKDGSLEWWGYHPIYGHHTVKLRVE